MCIQRYQPKQGVLMTITKRLTKHGNSFALVIERPILDLLGIDDTTLLQVSTPDGASIVISPVKSESRQKRFAKSLEQVNRKYGRVLKKLAE